MNCGGGGNALKFDAIEKILPLITRILIASE